MKLYIKPGACSLSTHIILREAGLPFDLVKVEFPAKTLPDGASYLSVNPKGQVPALGLDEGGVLTEAAVIAQYLADKAPDSGLLPAAGGMERYRVLEWLNFIATELHKSFTPLFRPNTPEEYKPVARDIVAGKLAMLDAELADRPFLAGAAFTAADAYCFTVLRWTRAVAIDLAAWPNLTAYVERVGARPAVAEAIAAEKAA
ncbi:glutathione transferase GstA [Azospirillum sp. SYSU D00513]|uniref:glutathione transferase GstA n=1 Tax=Azospirillum sp. SYSU D00513 TaxID=2812561 RepID=UPI001A976A09